MASTVIVAKIKPFKSATQNRIQMLIGIANALQIVILLSLSNYNTAQSTLLRNILIGLLVGVVLFLVVLIIVENRHCCTRAEHSEDHEPAAPAPAFVPAIMSLSASSSSSSFATLPSPVVSAPASLSEESAQESSADSMSELAALLADHTDVDGVNEVMRRRTRDARQKQK
eukprot:c16179_g1_i1.p2 GENE.c16179_g1_i1~~c16179_g1_i1.p2  ORF type:complete len:171 (-),score=27.96 c16179_g1_i1:16-528(-)